MDRNSDYKTPDIFPNDSFGSEPTITPAYFNEEFN